MELIRTFREKQMSQRQQDIFQASEDKITLTDFDGRIYIAVQDVPLVLVGDDWSVSQILEKLSEMRQNYINSEMKKFNIKEYADRNKS